MLVDKAVNAVGGPPAARHRCAGNHNQGMFRTHGFYMHSAAMRRKAGAGPEAALDLRTAGVINDAAGQGENASRGHAAVGSGSHSSAAAHELKIPSVPPDVASNAKIAGWTSSPARGCRGHAGAPSGAESGPARTKNGHSSSARVYGDWRAMKFKPISGARTSGGIASLTDGGTTSCERTRARRTSVYYMSRVAPAT